MSQHDFEILAADANTGITYRAAVNAALQALASNNSGGTAPSTTYPHQFWMDTANNLLKQRNATNDAWITRETLHIGEATGTGNTITCTFTPPITALTNNLSVLVESSAGNNSFSVTFAPDGLTAKTVVKGSDQALIPGDIPGANVKMHFVFDSSLDKWVLQNPKYPPEKVTTVTADYTLLDTDDTVLVDATTGAVMITVPTAVGRKGKRWTIKKIDNSANAVTMNSTGGEYFDEYTSITLGGSRDYRTIESEGTNYIVVGGRSLVPTGAVMPYAGATEPQGFLLCSGQAVSRTSYARLFNLIGTTFGVGDGSTTFNVPDLRGRLPLGKDNMGGTSANRVTATEADNIGQGSGGETHTHNVASSGGHQHQMISGGSGTVWATGDTAGQTAANSGAHAHTTDADNGMNPYQTLNYIIKM